MITGQKIKFFTQDLFGILQRFWNGEPILDSGQLRIFLRKYLKDMTFLEIFNENKWNLNITVTNSDLWGE